jgi:AAHS family benzoate transporter-like MFS transporter
MRQIDVHKLADEARFNTFHGLVLFWCALIIIFDGYDLAVSGIALPSIMKQMGVDATRAGFMVSSALFGMMFGAIFLGTVADRIGRRWAIAICIALFSLFTAAAGFAKDPLTFAILRFLAGVGIGGVMPNVVAQMTEYAPKKIRATLVTLMFSGYAVGGIVAALLGKGLIEAYGWQSVFFAAALPLVLIPLILRSLLESMPFLLAKGRTAELKQIAAKLEPNYKPVTTDRFALPAEDRADSAPFAPFREGRGFSTVMFWVAFFMCLFWCTPQLVADQADGRCGLQPRFIVDFVLVLNVGAMIRAVAGGWPTGSTSRSCWRRCTRWPQSRSRCSATRCRRNCCSSSSASPVPRRSARRSSPTRTPGSSTPRPSVPPVLAGRLASAAAARSLRRSGSACSSE